VGNGKRWGLTVDYICDGDVLVGTGGAVRRAVDAGAMEASFFVTYGDSYLPIDYRSVWQSYESCGFDILMTVFRNRGSWDSSNVEFSNGRVTVYAKRGQPGHKETMNYIDFGLLCMNRSFVQREIPANAVLDLHQILNMASVAGRLAGHEVTQRFYEIGSVAGIHDLEAFLGSSRSNNGN
jgi:NDP-sugar pyrophosphorylase family protein